jgi:large subunit ribosomal protein L10
MLTRSDKEALVEGIKANINDAQALFLTNLIGVSANDAVAIRKKVREANGNIIVTRNTLFQKAAEGTYAEELLKDLKGTNAVAFAFEDAPGVAKALYDANKENELVALGDGYLDQKELTKAQVLELAKLPNKDQMLATLLATFNAPVSAFVRVLFAIQEQKESGVEPTPVEAAPAEEAAPEAKPEGDAE